MFASERSERRTELREHLNEGSAEEEGDVEESWRRAGGYISFKEGISKFLRHRVKFSRI